MYKRIMSGMLALFMAIGAGLPGNVSILSETGVSAAEIEADDMAAESSAKNLLLPTEGSDISNTLIRSTSLVATDDGYMRVFHKGDTTYIEYYDDEFNILSKRSIDLELSLWGGFYAGSDAYYIVEGQNNTAENNTAEVIRVIKYDTDWNRLGAANITSNPNIFGGKVRYPFNVGCVEMAEYGGKLYIVTGHEGYVDPQYNQGHQGYLMISVDEETMEGKIVDCDLWHSFAQYITLIDTEMYVAQLSEGSRGTYLWKYNAEDGTRVKSIETFAYGGNPTSAWAIPTYSTVDGVEASADNVLCLGTSIDQSQYDNYTSKTAYNVYLTVTPKSNFTAEASDVVWLTDHEDDGTRFRGVDITKINDDRFLVMWEENDVKSVNSDDYEIDVNDALSAHTLHYIFVNGDGKKISKEFTTEAAISQCRPILKDSAVSFCSTDSGMVNFYSIDVETGEFSKETDRIAGENITWEIDEEGTLTISGTGEVSGSSSWKSIGKSVKKLVIGEGITSIGANAFNSLSGLEEVYISDGVESIGDEAFAYNGKLNKITIPASVTSIGEDILWVGSYWVSDNSHVVYASIYLTDPNCYAAEYAETNKIKHGVDISLAEIVGLEESYEYDLGSPSPTYTVMFGDTELVAYTDYYVSRKYPEGGSLGTVTLTIRGYGNGYIGELTASYEVVAGDISKYNCTLAYDSKLYTGEALEPTVTVKGDGGYYSSLYLDKDYTVTYEDNIEAGTAKVIIEGIGNYTGTVIKTFEITQLDITEYTMELSETEYDYDGTAKEPEVSVFESGYWYSTYLEEGTDYIVTYEDNIEPGTATVTVTGIGKYSGTLTSTFTIIGTTPDSSSPDTDDSSSEPDDEPDEIPTEDQDCALYGKVSFGGGAEGDMSDVKILLADAQGNEYDADVLPNGIYKIPEAPSGTYTLTVSASDAYAARTYTVELGDGSQRFDVLICLLGDVNCDGKVSFNDIVELAAHIKGVKTLDGYMLSVANVTRDEVVSVNDLTLMAAKVKGISDF